MHLKCRKKERNGVEQIIQLSMYFAVCSSAGDEIMKKRRKKQKLYKAD